MKTLIIRKKSEPEKRVEIRTDLMGDGGMFTVMTINGKIEGYTIPFHVGSITDSSKVSNFLADNTDLEAVWSSPSDKEKNVPVSTPIFDSIKVNSIVDEDSYKKVLSKAYREANPFETIKDNLPFIVIQTQTNVSKPTEYELAISKDGEDVEFDETDGAKLGTLSEDKKKLTLKTNLTYIIDVDSVLGKTPEDRNGLYKLVMTLNETPYIRVATI